VSAYYNKETTMDRIVKSPRSTISQSTLENRKKRFKKINPVKKMSKKRTKKNLLEEVKFEHAESETQSEIAPSK
jgi:hypothetical protein